MCKHLAAVLYGIGTRLDRQPELLFHLRKVDHLELIDAAVPTTAKKTTGKTLASAEVAGVFGIEIATSDKAPSEPEKAPPRRRKVTAAKGSKTAVVSKKAKALIRKSR